MPHAHNVWNQTTGNTHDIFVLPHNISGCHYTRVEELQSEHTHLCGDILWHREVGGDYHKSLGLFFAKCSPQAMTRVIGVAAAIARAS
jgi:hypothetical protein